MLGRFQRRPPIVWVSVAVASLIIAPILSVLWNIFQPGKGNWPHLASTVLPDYILSSLTLMVGVGIGVGVLGTGLAWLVVMFRFPGRRFFEWALILPLAAPAYVVAYAYTDFLQGSGPVQTLIRDLTGWSFQDYWFPNIRSMGGAIAIFTAVLIPYVYLLARKAFLEQSVCLLQASRTLGRSPWRSFIDVALPLARPAIVAGIALALMETLADFGTVAHFGLHTFTTGIYRTWASMGDPVAAAQLSSILVVFVFVLLLMEQQSRRQARYHQTTGRYREIQGTKLEGAWGAAATAFCAVPLVVGFVAPFLVLLWMALTDGHNLFSARYLTLTMNSVTLAGATALVAVLLAFLLSYAERVDKSRLTVASNKVAGIGYAIPGSIIAVGVLIPVAYFDNQLNALVRAHFDVNIGLLLTGSLVALIFAYLVRFMAIALNTVQSSFVKVSPNMEDAARTLGHGAISTARRVHVPIMTGGMLTAGLIVFVDVMKELPATLIMRPFNFDTLAIQAYNLASDERLSQAATPSLVILACGLIPIVVLSRAIMRSRPGS